LAELIIYHLDYFFGEDSQCSAHPSFPIGLSKRPMNYERSIVMQYKNESQNVASNSFSMKFFIIVVIFSYTDTLANDDDDEFNEWLE
jgi:hypothetical protein